MESPTPRSPISAVIPALDEELELPRALEALARIPEVGEVVVADGGSGDRTVELARGLCARVVSAPPGRGPQLRAGAAAARGEVLLFLHADSRPHPQAGRRILEVLAEPGTIGGSFRPRFDGPSRAARFLTCIYPHLHLLGLCYGDAGLFVRREAYERAGGFGDEPLFEDLALARRLERGGKLLRLPLELEVSSRRFEGRSFALVFARWALLQVLWWSGAPPARLARLYPKERGGRAGSSARTPRRRSCQGGDPLGVTPLGD